MIEGSILIGDCAFWRRGCGEPARQRELLKYLAGLGPVDLVYYGDSLGEYEQLTTRLMRGLSLSNVRCHMLRPVWGAGSLNLNEKYHAIRNLVAESQPKRIVVTSAALSWIPLCVPEGIATFIDGESANVAACLSSPEIVDAIRRFGAVLCARSQDLEKAQVVLGVECCQLAATPISLQVDTCSPVVAPNEVARVGVYFGAGRLSYDAVLRVRDAVWNLPQMQAVKDTVQMVIGVEDCPQDVLDTVQAVCSEFTFTNVGEDDCAYFQSLSCVYIPNTGSMPQALVLEALGHLCPVITEPKAIAGLSDVMRDICSVQDNGASIVQEMLRFAQSLSARNTAVQMIRQCAEAEMSRQTCFAVIEVETNRMLGQSIHGDVPEEVEPLLHSLAVGSEGTGVSVSTLDGGQGGDLLMPKVCVCLRKFESRYDDWLPLTRLSGVKVILRSCDQIDSCDDGSSNPCQLVITDDYDMAMEVVKHQSKDVWLCDVHPVAEAPPRLRHFTCANGIRWHVGELAAHLAVWLAKYTG